jgi:hypothetical protein
MGMTDTVPVHEPIEPLDLRLSGYAEPPDGLTIESRSRAEEKW